MDEDMAPGRCFGTGDVLYEAYHDLEWGRPVHGDRALFERLSLEAFQTGLSWIIVLRKRDALRAAFAGFEPEAVAGFGEEDVARLVADTTLIRNRLKIEAVIANARALIALHDEGASLDRLVWSHAPTGCRRPRTWRDLPDRTPESAALSKALKAAGFRFVGPVTAYATMQAAGLVNDHLEGCLAGDRLG
jgi:DNA-3-methyladenine glycosylase I